MKRQRSTISSAANPVEDEQRIDWIVETADVTEAPLYLQIARQLHRAGLLVYVSANPKDHRLDTRSVDRAELRLRLLETWKQAIVNGYFPAGVALSREDRVAAIEQLSVLACIGLRHDTLQVELEEFEKLVKQSEEWAAGADHRGGAQADRRGRASL